MVEMVIPMEDLADPMPIDFTFKCTNTNDATIYVKSEIISPPAGWNTTGAELHGSLAVGVDDYFLNDNNTRDKPANLTEEIITFRLSYYSDAGYTLLVNSEDVSYTITYVDFDDVGFTVVDDDTFEADTEGWTAGAGDMTVMRWTGKSRTGVASLLGNGPSMDTGAVGYGTKSFAIGAVTRAFIRVWLLCGMTGATDELIFELITDAGGGSERIIKIAFDVTPKGGTEICDQWLCIALKMPVNGTYEVQLKVSVESGSNESVAFDDIRVVQS